MNSPASDTPFLNELTIADVVVFLKSLASLELAESWDNVGLLWGDDRQRVGRVMTCLTLTSDVADEAVARGAELIVTHHPIFFRPIQRLTAETSQGRTLLTLAKSGIAVYSAHTAYDSAAAGINAHLADRLDLQGVSVLRPATMRLAGSAGNMPKSGDRDEAGAGRCGTLSPKRSLGQFIGQIKSRLGLAHVDFVGRPEMPVERLAIACGSAAEFLNDALERGCQALLTGEARFHACLEARDAGLALILIGHFASEQPAMRQLAEQIGRRFPVLEVWASSVESDPIQRA